MPQLSQLAPSTGDQVFKYMSVLVTVLFKSPHPLLSIIDAKRNILFMFYFQYYHFSRCFTDTEREKI